MQKLENSPPISSNSFFSRYCRLLSYLKPYRMRFSVALLAMVVYGATDGAVPYLLKRVLDDVFGSQNETMLRYLVIAIFIFAVIRGLFGYYERYLPASIGHYIIRDLRNEINKKLLLLPASFFQQNSTGSLIARVTNDTLMIRTALTDAVAALLKDSVRISALLIMAFYLDPMLAGIAFIGFPLALIPVIKFGKNVRKLSKVGQEQLGGLTSLLQETIVGQRIVQAFTREKYEQERFERENESFTRTVLKAEKYGSLSAPSNEFFASLAIAAIVFYGGVTVIGGVRTQGDFIAFITSIFLLYDPLKKMSRMNTTVQAGIAASERVFTILDWEVEIKDRDNAVELITEKPFIEYKKVWFRYPQSTSSEIDTNGGNKDKWALENINLQIHSGETLALVGMSGGGKSSIANLLVRFYDPQEGSINIDGCDIRDHTLRSLRRSISVVSQYTFLFNDTVFNNIAYGKENATEDDVYRAARAANAHVFIQSLPDAYQTVIGEQGLKLSGGERARIAIARALLKNAPILVLDEATASLDSESEGLVQEAIDKLMEGRTVLVIAHRLATVRKANRIAVVSFGKILEMGTHEELLKKGGEYAKLYRLQFCGSMDVHSLEANSLC